MASAAPVPAHISREFAVPPQVVFDAWLNPNMVKRWMFVSPHNRIENVTVDRRIGGQFSIMERSGGKAVDHYGRYRVIDRPRRLAFTLSVPRHFPGVTCVTVEIEPRGEGTRMNFTQTGVDRSVTEENWRTMFDRLARVIEPEAMLPMFDTGQ